MTQAPVRPDLKTGAKASKEAAEANRGGSFSRQHFITEYLKADGDSVVIRMITPHEDDELAGEGWPTAVQHNMIATREAPKDYKGHWPKAVSPICRRHDEQFKAFKDAYGDCYVCANKLLRMGAKDDEKFKKPQPRTWAIGCLRKEIILTEDMLLALDLEEHAGHKFMRLPGVRAYLEYLADPANDPRNAPVPAHVGKRVGYTDETREVEVVGEDGKPTGETKQELALVIMNMAYENFFAPIQAIGAVCGSVCDRDIVISRRGITPKVDYDAVVANDTSETLAPGLPSWKKYEDAVREQKLDLVDMLSYRAGDELTKFLDPTRAVEPRGDRKAAEAPEEQQAGPVGEDRDPDTRERLEAIRSRMPSARKASPPPDVD